VVNLGKKLEISRCFVMAYLWLLKLEDRFGLIDL